MNVSRPGPSHYPTDVNSQPPASPLHAAVASGDPALVMQLRQKRERANKLDANGQSPLDMLQNMQGLDERSRSGLRMALLQSLNPTAPVGYLKPEALHGSPWGFEILESRALKGGVNDSKGGAQSLEGKVFFSDRTPELVGSDKTRGDLRVKAREYSAGKGALPSNASSRVRQHRLTQAMLSGRTLQTGAPPMRIQVSHLNDPDSPQVVAWLQNYLHHTYIAKGTEKNFVAASLEHHAAALNLPQALTLEAGGREVTLQGKDLQRLYRHAATGLQQQLEGGKAPFLGLLNQGAIVPLVFGFDKINNLSQHKIHYQMTGNVKQYSYQSETHPLSGSRNGGKLKEIEVRSLADLATLCLGCAAKGVTLPADVLIRVKPQKNVKAQYLDVRKFGQFQQSIRQQVNHVTGGTLHAQSMEGLQALNTQLRASDLASLL